MGSLTQKDSLNFSLGLDESKNSQKQASNQSIGQQCNINSDNKYVILSNNRTSMKDQYRKSVSDGSDTSAIIRMNQRIKKKILRNHIMVILLLNLIQIGSLLFSMIWPGWYDDSNSIPNQNTNSDNPQNYEINNHHVSVNGFRSQNNKEIGGISSFIMFSAGILIQLLYLFQLLAFFKAYPESIQNRGCKLIKFKTCRWLCLFLYIGAICYWILVVFLVQIVSDAYNFSQLCYGFWISISCVISFVLINIYFNFVKKQIRKNDMVSNLLNANRYFQTNQEGEEVNEF